MKVFLSASDDGTYWQPPSVPRPPKPKPINMQSLQVELMAEVDRINREKAER